MVENGKAYIYTCMLRLTYSWCQFRRNSFNLSTIPFQEKKQLGLWLLVRNEQLIQQCDVKSIFRVPHKRKKLLGWKDPLTLDTLTDVWMLLGWGSAKSKFPRSSRLRAAKGLAGTSGGGPKISLPLSSLLFDSEICFAVLESASLSSVPLSSRCLATSGNEDAFLGDTVPSALNVIWLMHVTVCCYEKNIRHLSYNSTWDI
jgi:hypothetical protein